MRGLTREQIIKAAAEAAKKCNGPLTVQEMTNLTGISYGQIRWRFADGWSTVLREAGVADRAARRPHVRSHMLMKELHRLIGLLGRMPTWAELQQKSEYSPPTYKRRYGGTPGILAAYRRWCRHHGTKPAASLPAEKAPALKIEQHGRKAQGTPGRVEARRVFGENQNAFGQPLAFKGIANEPVNEMGVVHLFGAIGAELGFSVQRIGRGFPDCVALRRGDSGLWEPVRIEFEFRSASFLSHRHEISKCDVIVCWEDDWKGCPIEVVELRRHVDRLRKAG